MRALTLHPELPSRLFKVPACNTQLSTSRVPSPRPKAMIRSGVRTIEDQESQYFRQRAYSPKEADEPAKQSTPEAQGAQSLPP